MAGIMNKVLIGVLGLGLLLLALLFPSQGGEEDTAGGDAEIDWILNDLEGGISIAREQNKPVLISFWAGWCSWCVRMDEEVMSDAEVAQFISENFVPVKINSDLPENRGLLMLYQITGHPSFVILDKNGRFLGKGVGYMPKDVFLQFLKRYVSGS
jgi:thioredoxin-related protein